MLEHLRNRNLKLWGWNFVAIEPLAPLDLQPYWAQSWRRWIMKPTCFTQRHLKDFVEWPGMADWTDIWFRIQFAALSVHDFVSFRWCYSFFNQSIGAKSKLTPTWPYSIANGRLLDVPVKGHLTGLQGIAGKWCGEDHDGLESRYSILKATGRPWWLGTNTKKKSRLRRHETTTWKVLKSRGCSCDINQTRLERNENVVVAEKPTWSYNTIFDYTCRYEIKKELSLSLYIYIYIAIGAVNSAKTRLRLPSWRWLYPAGGTTLTAKGQNLPRLGGIWWDAWDQWESSRARWGAPKLPRPPSTVDGSP
jgi:hypothetical protein